MRNLLSVIILIISMACISYAGDNMILVYKIPAAGSNIYLPLAGTINVEIDWGDTDNPTKESFTVEESATHTYGSANDDYEVIITISGSLSAYGNITTTAELSNSKLIKVLDFGNLGISSFCCAFYSAYNLEQVPTYLPTSVTDISGMFGAASNFNFDISGWNTSNITNMMWMFTEAKSFNQNLNSWDVSNVTEIEQMFSGAISFNQDISSWKLSNVTSLYALFSGAISFNQDISNWDMSNITDMYEMFEEASSFNQDISNWNVSNITSMTNMFHNAKNFNQDISNWNVLNVNSMNNMLLNSGLSLANYDKLLIEWSKLALKSNVSLGASNISYSSSAEDARLVLTETYSWTITDAGPATTQIISGITYDPEIYNMVYGDTKTDIVNLTTATTSSNLDLILESSDTNIVKISSDTVTAIGVGLCSLYVVQIGNQITLPTDTLVKIINVSKKELTVSVQDETKYKDDVNPKFTIIYTGFIDGEDESFLTTTPITYTNATINSDVGIYDITISGGESDNYTFSYTDGKLTINAITTIFDFSSNDKINYKIATNTINLIIESNLYKLYSYKIINISGSKLASSNINSKQTQININNLKNGLYILQIFDNSTLVKNIKFIN